MKTGKPNLEQYKNIVIFASSQAEPVPSIIRCYHTISILFSVDNSARENKNNKILGD